MKFHKEIEFAGPPDEVFAVLVDEDFRRKVALEAGAASAEVSVTHYDDGSVDAAVISRRSSDALPSAARRTSDPN